ncbi:hypothetical protein FB567DRAFT_75732 [Paraphoma chrysanthemicola]|uniref:Cytochrome b561 domain-containing protein n=1 Tax=Paraphoma chrysanthemicola TaxID=798071 RepID=A0A8K0R323_9PLEO|nr:hypothetical protein FB567DRAFT_75732 [Paraphoma chrysanthemicola]
MYASGKPVWYLPFAFIGFSLLLCTVLVLHHDKHAASHVANYPASLKAIFTPETIDALNHDPQLQDALLSLTEAIAETSTDLGDRFRFQHLKRFGANLTDGITLLRSTQQFAKRKRGLLQDLSGTFGQLLGGNGGAGGLNLTGGLSGILGGLGGSLADSLTTPALFLGIGLGMGASTGLNLTDMQSANAQSTKVASAYNASATGANLIAQNLGTGLAGQIAPSFSSGTSNISLGAAAFSLATGIGNATAYGFNLTQQQALPSNDSGIEAAAGNFGLGIATPIVSNIDLQAVMNNLGGAGASMFAQQLPQIAAAAGQGLGEGAKNGLGLAAPTSPSLRKRQQPSPDPSALDIPATVSSFTKGLSQSFLTGSDLSKLNPLGGTNLTSMTDLQSMLRPLAAGAGAGIGMGVAVGLNFKSTDAQPTFGGNITGKDEQTALIAEGFVQNMLSNFLANSTALQQASTLLASNQPSFLRSVDGAKAAEGFARGTIEGVMSAMSSVGGLKNLISGQVPANAMENVPVLQPSSFNDSVNGSAVGFARGLTGPGTIFAAEVIRNLTGGTRNATIQAPQKRNADEAAGKGAVAPFKALTPRQNPPPISPPPSFPPAIDAQTLQTGLQKAIDTVTCQGIGGVAAAGLGFMNAAKAKNKGGEQQSAPLDPRVLGSLPDGPIVLSSEGNSFRIVVKEASVEVNGLGLVPFAVLTGLHVLLTVLAFLVFLPLYLILGAAWRFSVLAGHPVNEAKNRKWRMGFLITFAILGVSGIVLGIVGMGSARHFRDQHGIFGLICLIVLFPTVAFSILRLRTTIPHPSPAAFNGLKAPLALFKTPQKIYLLSGLLTQLLLALGQFAFIQGFSALRSISLCLVDAVLNSSATANLMGVLLMVQISATALVGVRAWLEQHIAKREVSASSSSSESFGIGKRGEKGRQSSIQTFGFDRKTTPPSLDFSKSKPRLVQRKTEELVGAEDNAISTPFNVRKEGEIVSPLSPRDMARPSQDSPRVYNPKTGVYEYENEYEEGFGSVPVTYQAYSTSAGPKTEGVSTRDLFPPLEDQGVGGRGLGRAPSSSYSRPFGGGMGRV